MESQNESMSIEEIDRLTQSFAHAYARHNQEKKSKYLEGLNTPQKAAVEWLAKKQYRDENPVKLNRKQSYSKKTLVNYLLPPEKWQDPLSIKQENRTQRTSFDYLVAIVKDPASIQEAVVKYSDFLLDTPSGLSNTKNDLVQEIIRRQAILWKADQLINDPNTPWSKDEAIIMVAKNPREIENLMKEHEIDLRRTPGSKHNPLTPVADLLTSGNGPIRTAEYLGRITNPPTISKGTPA